MDDVIIIILTLVFTVLAAVNQARKKRIPENQKEPDFWKTILAGEEPEELPVPQRKPEHKPTAVPSPVKTVPRPRLPETETFAKEGTRNETIKFIAEKKAAENVSFPDEEIYETEPLTEGFSLRKAVVYYEILNPKYL